MGQTISQQATNRGFALIVVLFALLILTALFATAQNIALSQLQLKASENTLIVRGHENNSILELAIDWRLRTQAENLDSFFVEFETGPAEVIFQDVGGLIDLNTASPDLLSKLAEYLGIDRTGLSAYRDWRRTPHRLLRISDFARVTNSEATPSANLSTLATVHSGRPGFAQDVATSDVLKVVGGTPESFQSAQSGVNFLVLIRHENKTAKGIGTIHLGPSKTQSRILAFVN